MTAIATLLGIPIRQYDGPEHKWNELMGVELEIEDPAYPSSNPSGYLGLWTAHEDHSLRNGIEYYTAAPMGGPTLERAIRTFYESGIRYTNGPRTSTHIHMNMTDADDSTLKSLFMIMYMVEDALYAAVEESRKWGGYSVSLKEMAPARVRALVNPQHDRQFLNAICPQKNAERYYGLNTNVKRHGTVEFRYFPGGPSRTDLESWIDFVVLTKKAARALNPEDLIARINGPADVVSFLNEYYGPWADKLLAVSNPDMLYHSFMTIAAMAGDEHGPELGNNLVFVNERLLAFVIRHLLNDHTEAAEMLRAGIGNAQVLSTPDWGYYITQARAVARSKKKGLDLSSYADTLEDAIAEAPSPWRATNTISGSPARPVRAPQRAVFDAEATRRQMRELVRQQQEALRSSSNIPRVTPVMTYDDMPDEPYTPTYGDNR